MKDCMIYSISPLYLVDTVDAMQFVSGKTSDFFASSTTMHGDVSEVEPDFEPEEIVNSNKQNILVGNLGEEIAHEYLAKKYSKLVKRISTQKGKCSEGYDLIVGGKLCFEIKTSLAKKYEFDITVNELQKASEKQSNYFLFYIMIDRKQRTAFGFIFKNPAVIFNIDYTRLFQKISIFEPQKFRGNLQSYIPLVEKISLTEYLDKIVANRSKFKQIFS